MDEKNKKLIKALEYSILGCSCNGVEKCRYCAVAKEAIQEAKEEHKVLNTNYIAYLKANNLNANDENIKMWEFIEWVNIKASKFRRENKLEDNHPISRLQAWTEYIEKGN